jgi:hypothetical protein
MPTSSSDMRVTVKNLLVPISLMSLTMLLVLAFQTMQILRDRDALNNARGQQEKAFEDSQRLQGQLNALLLGTKKLADEGNKDAVGIVDKLKTLGIQINPQAAGQQGEAIPAAPVPAATEKQEPGPVKP